MTQLMCVMSAVEVQYGALLHKQSISVGNMLLVPVGMGNYVIMQTLDPVHGGTRTLGPNPMS
jgi:hypothetical protein